MKKIISILICSIFLLAASNAEATTKSEIISEINKVKRSCSKSLKKTFEDIKNAEKLKSKAKELLEELDKNNGYDNGESLLNKAKSNIYTYLKGARNFKNEMYWCDSFDVYLLLNANDAYNEYNRKVKKVNNAYNKYSNYTNYYSIAINNYNQAIKVINNINKMRNNNSSYDYKSRDNKQYGNNFSANNKWSPASSKKEFLEILSKTMNYSHTRWGKLSKKEKNIVVIGIYTGWKDHFDNLIDETCKRKIVDSGMIKGILKAADIFHETNGYNDVSRKNTKNLFGLHNADTSRGLVLFSFAHVVNITCNG